jgi:hypothetical protein
VPFLGVPIYLIVNGQDLGKRDVEEAQTSPAHFDEYIRSISGSGGTAAEIEKPKQLLDSGAITQAEFDALKAKAVG